jgi:hypothetical protein|tara:strand:+ start:88 stop:621 length:534 start_codon:yes stop_codon:yes gene_type:complete
MEKFLNVPVYLLVTNGGPLTSITPTGGSELQVSSATFLADVSLGDIVHNATADDYYLVINIASNTQLDLTPLGGAAANIPASQQVYIHSGSSYNNQLVSIGDVGLIEQLSTSTTTIAYDGPSATDLITLVHTPVATGSEAMRDQVQEQMEAALITSWTNVAPEAVFLNQKVIGISIG